ncbi:unnamed protein product [Toxocara canis]|uniref:MOSC domain-containing protein n=1 Tax=Toxocara canis TaxID=6265 RepID=A0A183UA98_TOXCA|nr:unnamed protein product [Toxocara canis]
MIVVTTFGTPGGQLAGDPLAKQLGVEPRAERSFPCNVVRIDVTDGRVIEGRVLRAGVLQRRNQSMQPMFDSLPSCTIIAVACCACFSCASIFCSFIRTIDPLILIDFDDC